jgi:hypothetical protein
MVGSNWMFLFRTGYILMDTNIPIFYDDTPYSIITTKVDNGRGYWAYVKVEIFDTFDKIGEYIRKYPSHVKETFHPFLHNGIWYALYSDDYTATKIAKLTDGFEYWCGEEPSEIGFCPTEFYVPLFYFYKTTISDVELLYTSTHADRSVECIKKEYTNYGFVSGCHWGDDFSWKLRYIDLSDIANKNFKIEEKFGYLELPDKALKDCIEIEEYDSSRIRIENVRTFDL